MRKLAALVLLISVACSSSHPYEPPDLYRRPPGKVEVRPGVRIQATGTGFVVAGRATDHSGRPLVGAHIEVERQIDGVFGGLAQAMCILCPPPPSCVEGDEASTSSDGRFSLGICRRPKDRFLLMGSRPPQRDEKVGAETYYEFVGGRRSLALPGLRFWEPGLRLDLKSGTARWSHLPRTGFGRSTRYELWFTAPNEDVLEWIWAEDFAYPLQRFDPRVLEDATGTWSVLAHARARPDRGCGRRTCSPTQVTYRSPALPFRGPGPPPSRNKPCLLGAQDREPPRRRPACWVNDGNLILPRGGEVSSAAIDLERKRLLSLVVVRGCFFCAVHTSTDGRSWKLLDKPFGNLNDTTGIAVVPVSGRRARYVRVQERGGFFYLREISVW